MCVFITIMFVAVTELFKLFISLQCEYNELQFGTRIGSIEVSKHSYASLHNSMSTTKLTAKKSIHENLLF